MANSGGPNIAGIVGTLWGIAADIVSWEENRQRRNREAKYDRTTVYLDQHVYRDKVHGLIYRLDAARNLAGLAAIYPVRYRAGASRDELEAIYRTILWLRSMPRVSLDAPMPSYTGLTDPESEVGAILVDDTGWYNAQGRYILPALADGSSSPMLPTWAAAGGAAAAGVAFGAPGWILGGLAGVGTQLIRGDARRTMTCRDFLNRAKDGQSALQKHESLWNRPAGTSLDAEGRTVTVTWAEDRLREAYRHRSDNMKRAKIVDTIWTYSDSFKALDRLAARKAESILVDLPPGRAMPPPGDPLYRGPWVDPKFRGRFQR